MSAWDTNLVATRARREGFLRTPPVRFTMFGSEGPFFVDDVQVSEAVFDRAYLGDLRGARAVWLDEMDAVLDNFEAGE